MTIGLIMLLIVLLAGFVQGIAGFGSAMIAVSLLSYFIDIKTVIPLVAQLSLITVTILTFQLRNHFKFSHIKPLIGGSLVGIPLGVLFLKEVNGETVRALLGLILITYGIWQLFFPRWKIRSHTFINYFLGFWAGVLGGAFNTNGPPAIIYVTSQSFSHHEMKVTLTSYFWITGILIITFHGANGLITKDVLHYLIYLAPALVLGTLMGSAIYKHLSGEKFRRIIFSFLIFMGIGLLVKSLFLH